MICQGRYKGQRDDYDNDIGHDYGNDCDLGHMQDIDNGNGHDEDECRLPSLCKEHPFPPEICSAKNIKHAKTAMHRF